MTDNFSFFTFSVFFGCTFEEFSDVVLKDDFWNGLVKNGKAYINSSLKNNNMSCSLTLQTKEVFENLTN